MTEKKNTFGTLEIDIDVVFEDFRDIILPDYAKKIREVNARNPVKTAWIRPSSRKNTHIKIDLIEPVTFETATQIRAYLDDDPFRLACDLTRAYLHGHSRETNRLWDVKIAGGERHAAGEWKKIAWK